MMLALLSLTLMTASADTDADNTNSAEATVVTRKAVPHVSLGRVTYDGDDLQQYAMVEDEHDFLRLVPGARPGTISGHGPGDVAVMLDGVVLLNQKRLGPLP